MRIGAEALADPHARAGRGARAGDRRARPSVRLVGMMAYEGQIAGLGDGRRAGALRGAAIRAMQARSCRELRERRAAVVARRVLREVAAAGVRQRRRHRQPRAHAAEAAVTEADRRLGLLRADAVRRLPRASRLQPAAMFALPVVRRPGARRRHRARRRLPRLRARPSRDRLPTPVPARRACASTAHEGAGEVQTPLRGAAADRAARSATASTSATPRPASCASASTRLHLLEGDAVVDEVPTYRGEGKCFL